MKLLMLLNNIWDNYLLKLLSKVLNVAILLRKSNELDYQVNLIIILIKNNKASI
jgi:hypothetical protein